MEGSSSRKIRTRFLVEGVETDQAIETRDSTGEEERAILTGMDPDYDSWSKITIFWSSFVFQVVEMEKIFFSFLFVFYGVFG